jgi:hypothetical protein
MSDSPSLPALRPCPFCGGEAEYRARAAGRFVSVVCAFRGCDIGPSTALHPTHADAAESWNRRAAVEQAQVGLLNARVLHLQAVGVVPEPEDTSGAEWNDER